MKWLQGKYITASLLCVLLLCAAFVSAPGIDEAAAATGLITGSVVNIRSAAEKGDNVVGSVYEDTVVEIVAQQGEWCKIKIGQITGWVHQSVIEAEAQAQVITVVKLSANLRSGPGLDYNKIGEAQQGDQLTVVETVGDWYKAKTSSGQVVYIRSDMTGPAGSSAVSRGNESVSSAAPASTGTSAPAAVSSGLSPGVILDGQLMQFEVAPVVDNSRVLVPLRDIFEAMGATVVWDQAAQTATATRGTTTVVLPLNSKYPSVNGVVWTLDVPAKVVQQRILAPLRFVGESLGGSAAWDANSYQVIMTSPADQPGRVVAVVVTKDSVNLRSTPEVGNNNYVESAVYGERMAVLDQSNGWYQVSRNGKNLWVAGWVVDVVREGDPAAASAPSPIPEPSPTPVADPTPEPAPTVSRDGLTVTSQRSSEGLEIVMESGKKLSTDIDTSIGMIRYEFAKREVEGNSFLQEYVGSSLIKVTALNSGTSAEVTIQFPAGLQYKTATENDGQREVFIVPNCLTGVSRSSFGSSGEKITINAVAPLNYTTETGDKQLKVVFKDVQLGEVNTSYKYSSPIISSVTFKKQTIAGKNSTVLTITTSDPAKFAVGTSNDDCTLNILFIDRSDISSRTPVVVLDAGHGGRDPGASGAVLAEKDVNLKIVLKAGKLLTAKGIKVVYTREDDTYLGVEERTAIANLCNAALFVSVHNNANVSSIPSGTETHCYYPLSDPSLYIQKEERYNLALRIQEALVDELGRKDRGVKQTNLAVLRESEMPSALVEMVFISNPEEEALLKKDSFLNLGAKAIAEGIAGYMKSYLDI